MSVFTLAISPTSDPFPFAALATAAFIKDSVNVSFNFERGETGMALTRAEDGTQVGNGDAELVVRTLAKAAGLASNSTQGEALIALSASIPSTKDFTALTAALDSLDDRLALRTYLDGHELTVVDWLVWGSIKGSLKPLGIMKAGKHPHLLRWFTHLESLPTTKQALELLAAARSASKSTKANPDRNKAASSFNLGLEDAEIGKVVTRFPPEPSGYLHIGHLKAAILNQYFAEMYKGKLIIRFDDTNPSKEKSEFEDSILADLKVLNIVGDKVTHTSDHFDIIYDYALKIIKEGKAYVDDTSREQMQQERMDGIESRCRNFSIEENLQRFELMKQGTPEGLKCCLRAKISVTDPNKAMRDPVIYRCNPQSHHRTGDKWKIYPTYDFACPIVDSHEGVTHALRTNEYRDRNPQYHWMIDAVGLRKVNIWDFSRLSFVYTFLSKRKLRECIELGLAKSWDDPRFPTFRGMLRRGMTTEALRQFMLSQGPSQNQVLLEWDSIWTLNKKIIDPIAPRFCAIATEGMVKVTINGAPTTPEVKTQPRHKKNADVGTKETVYWNEILIEQEDAQSFGENEEITLMDWGNAIVRSSTRSPSGQITSLALDLNLAGDFKSTSKKITWLSAPKLPHNTLVHTTLLDYDYLVTKRKLDKDDSVADLATPQTEFRVEAVADANVASLKEGDIIQFERKGYFRLDQIVEGNTTVDERRLEFVRIPDGRAAGIALKAPGADAATLKGTQGKKTEAGKAPDEVLKMYKVDPIVSKEKVVTPTGMYKVSSVYDDDE